MTLGALGVTLPLSLSRVPHPARHEIVEMPLIPPRTVRQFSAQQSDIRPWSMSEMLWEGNEENKAGDR